MRIATCCCCGSNDLAHLPTISASGLANNLEDCGDSVRKHNVYPLGLSCCNACTHIQLSEPIDPSCLFSDYSYKSGVSRLFQEHFAEYARTVSGRIPGRDRKVLDIGFNDGCLLDSFYSLGWATYGVDPAENLVKIAQEAKKHEVTVGFFGDQKVFDDLRFNAITANNVFAHTRSINGFLRSVKDILEESGSFIFEVQYLPDMLNNFLFDMIYHEHTSYHHLSPLVKCLDSNGLTIYDVERIGTHGGSIRVYAKHSENTFLPINKSVTNLLDYEQSIFGESPITKVLDLLRHIKDLATDSTVLLEQLKERGQTVVGYTAPAKATTFLSCLPKQARDDFSFVVDDSPLKQGRYIPGTDIVITDDTRLMELAEKISPSNISIIVFAWNIASSVKESLINKFPQLASANFYTLLPKPGAC